MSGHVSRELILLMSDWAEQVGQDYEISSDELLSDLESVLSPKAHLMLANVIGDGWLKPQPHDLEPKENQ